MMSFNISIRTKSYITAAIALTTLVITPVLSPAKAGDTDPCTFPQRLSFSNSVDNPALFIIQNDIAYVLTDDHELIIIDLSVLDTYTTLSTTQLEVQDELLGLSVSPDGSAIYIIHRDYISIYNSSDITAPWFVRTYPVDIFSDQIVIHENTLYAESSISLDISSPHAPRLTHPDLTPTFDSPPIAIHNNTLYTRFLTPYDISSGTPQQLADRPTPNRSHYNIAFENNLIATIATDSNTYLYNQSDDFTITEQSAIDLDSSIQDLALTSGRLFLSTDTIEAFDVSNPADIFPIGQFTGIPGLMNPIDMIPYNNSYYTLSQPRRIARFQFHTNPIASYTTPSTANELAILKDVDSPSGRELAITTDEDTGIFIYDITDVSNTALIAVYETSNSTLGVDASSNPNATTAFIAAHQSGLDIVDLSIPSSPTLIANYNPGSSTQDVQVIDNLAYVVNRTQGLHILDVSDPANPTLVSSIDTPGHADDITIADHPSGYTLALISHGDQDHQIIDVTDPLNPAILSSIQPPQSTETIRLSMNNGYIYSADGTDGYRVFDATNPVDPFLIATHNTNLPESKDFAGMDGFPTKVGFGPGSTLIIANGQAGLAIYNNIEFTRPTLDRYTLIGNNLGNPPTSLRDFSIHDNLIFSVNRGAGLRIYDLYNCNPPCPADFNLDGTLNFFDLSIYLESYNNKDTLADLNGDGTIDFFDISILFNYFTTSCP